MTGCIKKCHCSEVQIEREGERERSLELKVQVSSSGISKCQLTTKNESRSYCLSAHTQIFTLAIKVNVQPCFCLQLRCIQQKRFSVEHVRRISI